MNSLQGEEMIMKYINIQILMFEYERWNKVLLYLFLIGRAAWP